MISHGTFMVCLVLLVHTKQLKKRKMLAAVDNLKNANIL